MDELEDLQQREVERHLSTTVKQSGIVFIGRIIGYALGLANYFILARLFGARVLGEYSLVLNTVSVITIITAFGLNIGLVKYISRYRADNSPNKVLLLVRSAVLWSALFSLFGGGLFFILRTPIATKMYHDGNLILPFIVGAWIIVPNALITVIHGVYRGFKDVRYFSLFNEIVRKGVFGIVLLILLLLSLRESVFVVSAFLLVSMLVIILLLFKTSMFGIGIRNIFFIGSRDKTQKRNIQRELFGYSSTMVFISFMSTLLHRIDKIMIGIFKYSELVGIYATADRIGTLPTILLISSNVIFSSVIAELYYQKKTETLESLYRTVTKWLVILTLPIIVSIVIFSKVILNFFGSEFIVGSSTLIVLSIAQMINTASGTNALILGLSGREKLLLFNNISMIVLNVGMNSILIPKMGILGAAIATGASIVIVNIVKTVEIKLLIGIFPYDKRFLHIFLNLAAIIGVSTFIQRFWSSIVAAAVCVLVNITISVFISFLFKDSSDEFIFQKVRSKLSSK